MNQVNIDPIVLIILMILAGLAIANLLFRLIQTLSGTNLLITQIVSGLAGLLFLVWLLSDSLHVQIAQGWVHQIIAIFFGFWNVLQFLWHLAYRG